MKKTLQRIKGILYILQFAITVFVMIVLMYLFRQYNHKLRKIWANLQLKLIGVRLEVVGSLDNECDLVIINHQSLLDIIILEYLHSRNIAWVAKLEIEKLPFFGHIIKAPKMISVDREDKAGLIKLIKDVSDRLETKRPIAIFPEGTRGDGQTMLPFKSGAKIVGNKFGLKVQPVVLIGTKQRLDSVKLLSSSGVVKVVFLEPVKATKENDWFGDIEKKMNGVFLDEVNQLEEK